MKINECSVIDNKVIDELIAECLHPEVYEALLHIKLQLKPLELSLRDAYNSGVGNTTYDSFEDCYDVTVTAEDYINQTEI